MKTEKLKNRQHSIIINASEEDRIIFQALKEKYHINISSFIRDQLKKLYENLENNKILPQS